MIAKLTTQYTHAPAEIKELFQAEIITEVFIGRSSTTVYRIFDGQHLFYLKTHPRSPHFSFAHEVSILRWLDGQLPVPSVKSYMSDVEYEYLVLTAVPGVNCVDAMNRLDNHRIVDLMAQGLRQIHQVNIVSCTFDERIAAKLKRAEYRVQNKLVDEDDFDDERLGMTAYQIYAALQEHQPIENDLVFTHGDYCLPNVLLNDERIGGFIDLDRAGVSDRYNDLAIASRSISDNLGSECEDLFFRSYGVDDIDHEKVQFYRMVDELF